MEEKEPIETTEKLFTRTRSRRYWDWVRIGVHAVIIGIFLLLFLQQRFSRIENMVLDGFLKYAGPKAVHPALALIEISDAAISEIGEWPWPRRYHAVMTRLLNEWGAAAIVFDFNFPNKTTDRDDQDLARVLETSKAPVYLPLDLKPQKEKKFWLHGMPVVLDKNEGKIAWVHSIPEIEKNAKAFGHHQLAVDPDGILRRFTPYVSDGRETFPYLALPVAYDFLGKKFPAETYLQKALGPDGKILIPWIKGWREQFNRYDFADLIHAFYGIQKGMQPTIFPEDIKGKICLIGITAPERTEMRATPLESSSPPLAGTAHVANSVLTGQWIRIAPAAVNAALLIVIGILATALFFMLRSAVSLFTGLSLGLGWIIFSFLLFRFFNLWLFTTYPVLLILALFAFSAIYVQLTATRERSALFHLATRDGLTGLYVIRHFRIIMNQIVREARLRKEPLSIILLDIDHFKEINDAYGHPAGDRVLQSVAVTLTKHIRKKRPFSQIDFAARYGGEEFIIMLRKTGLQEAAGRVAERLRKKIEETKIEWEGKQIPVTASFGVAALRPGENVPDPMVHRADAALYQAKKTGRNRVCAEKA